MRKASASHANAGPPLNVSLLRPGLRLAIGLSGGADSVALVRALARRSAELGLVLHAAHLHHGLRGAEADEDLEFSRRLAAKLGLPFHEARVDAAAAAHADAGTGKPAETIEEAARRLRYQWFRKLISETPLDAIATAHTLDDQAETVLAKFLRGAWTEGLAGISPVLDFPEGRIVRPLLAAKRADIEAYLRRLGQDWREDSSNRHMSFTRNRIRHELLPLLEGWNPQLREHLAQMAELARDEQAWWDTELARLAPQVLLPGLPARGGGRAAGEQFASTLAIEIGRLAAPAPAMQRRLLRHGADQLGAALDFAATEALRNLALAGRAGQKLSLAGGLRAERTARELRLKAGPADRKDAMARALIPEYSSPIPGEIDAPAFGLRIRVEVTASAGTNGKLHLAGIGPGMTATLRNWRPGDRVRLRYSAAPRKVKEVLERIRVTGSDRAIWPVLEIDGQILWMRGIELEPAPGLTITALSTLSGNPNATEGEPKIGSR